VVPAPGPDRPGGAQHRGLSLFMLELDSPGVEVRPTRQATGTEEFCELFLTDVRVPAACLIGEENAGWRMAQTTLATERAFNILELQARLVAALGEIAAQARDTPVAPGRMAADDAGVRQDLAARAAEIEGTGPAGAAPGPRRRADRRGRAGGLDREAVLQRDAAEADRAGGCGSAAWRPCSTSAASSPLPGPPGAG